jgi:hypothetical protein
MAAASAGCRATATADVAGERGFPGSGGGGGPESGERGPSKGDEQEGRLTVAIGSGTTLGMHMPRELRFADARSDSSEGSNTTT